MCWSPSHVIRNGSLSGFESRTANRVDTRLDASSYSVRTTTKLTQPQLAPSDNALPTSMNSSGIPSSFDPAFLQSDLDTHHLEPAPTTESFSDDYEALHQCIIEDRAKKTSQGIVIQHRAWRVTEAFRSDAERPIGTFTTSTSTSSCSFTQTLLLRSINIVRLVDFLQTPVPRSSLSPHHLRYTPCLSPPRQSRTPRAPCHKLCRQRNASGPMIHANH